MRVLLKVLMVVATVGLLADLATGVALARTVTASGIINEGETVTKVSNGKITLRDSSGFSIKCNITIRGTIKRSTSGQLRVLEPATNALIGRMTEGRVANCEPSVEITLLFGAGLWQIYKLEKHEGERSTFYVLHVQIRKRDNIFNLINCLIDALWTFEYNETTGILTILEARTLTRTGTVCHERETLSGSFAETNTSDGRRITLTLRDV
jgi:hypothetical protein